MKVALKHLLFTTALVGILAPVASAQGSPFDRGRHVGVRERGQPEYDPEPIRSGAFVISSSLLASAEYNDNVFAQPAGEIEDTVIRIQPQVSAQSDWSVHAIGAGINIDHRQYASEDTETSTDYTAFLSGRLDATRNFSLTGNVTGGQLTEARYEPGSQSAPEPAQNQYIGVDVGATYGSDRLQLDGRVGTRENNYQAFYLQRDVTENFVSARVSYAISPDIAVFGQARETQYEYEQSGVNRDGSQTTLQVGVNFELAAPFRGEISVGQVTDARDAPGTADAESLSLDASVSWFVTQLTTVTFNGFNGITDPGITQALSANTQSYSVRVDHELLRNLLLFGEVGFNTYEFNAAPGFPTFAREDDFYDVSVGAAYKLNKHAHLEFGYAMHSRDTSGTFANEIQQNVVSVGLRVFP